MGSLVTHDPSVAVKVVHAAAAWHGRILILDREAAAESTGHGSPLPLLNPENMGAWQAWVQALRGGLQAQTDLITRLESFVATHG